MEIVIDIDNIPNILNLDKNIIFFGKIVIIKIK